MSMYVTCIISIFVYGPFIISLFVESGVIHAKKWKKSTKPAAEKSGKLSEKSTRPQPRRLVARVAAEPGHYIGITTLSLLNPGAGRTENRIKTFIPDFLYTLLGKPQKKFFP